MDDFDCNCTIDLEEEVNPHYQHSTVCDGDRTNNIWWVNGASKLDQLTYEQVYGVLRTVPCAKADLLRITSDVKLRTLANETHLSESDRDDDLKLTQLINKGRGGAGTLPFYTVFRGNI